MSHPNVGIIDKGHQFRHVRANLTVEPSPTAARFYLDWLKVAMMVGRLIVTWIDTLEEGASCREE